MKIECVRCGHCCPDTCPSKVVDENNLAACIKHPLDGEVDNRGLFCNADPEYFYTIGIACAAHYPKRMYPDLKTERLENGQVIVVNQF